eukprot:scaffold23480_cov106-Cylindrotheca_fusiformis.AAC.5
MSISPKCSTISAEGAGGMRCVWIYCTGSLPEDLDSNGDSEMWESTSTLGDISHVRPNTILEGGPLLSKEGGLSNEDEAMITLSINAALERARQRRSQEITKANQSTMRRSLVEASMTTISPSDLLYSPPATPKPSPGVRTGGRKLKINRGFTV